MRNREAMLSKSSKPAAVGGFNLRVFAAIVLAALAAMGCHSTDCTAHSPWGDAKETRSHLDTYKHVLVVCVYEDHWEDKGTNRLSLHHFKATVVRSFKGDWSVGERIALVHEVDAPASTVTNGDAGSLMFLFTREHTKDEIRVDTGDFGHSDPELERGLQCAFAGRKPDVAQDTLRDRTSTQPKLTLFHNVEVPKEFRAGNFSKEHPGYMDGNSTVERYVLGYEHGWAECVQRFARNIGFNDPSPFIFGGWFEEQAGGGAGYGDAWNLIHDLIHVYGEQRVSEYLQQFRQPDEK